MDTLTTIAGPIGLDDTYTQPHPDAVLMTLPYSEVCMHMRVAGRKMWVLPLENGMAQLFRGDGRKFSFPVTRGEAGITGNDRYPRHGQVAAFIDGHWVQLIYGPDDNDMWTVEYADARTPDRNGKRARVHSSAFDHNADQITAA